MLSYLQTRMRKSESQWCEQTFRRGSSMSRVWVVGTGLMRYRSFVAWVRILSIQSSSGPYNGWESDFVFPKSVVDGVVLSVRGFLVEGRWNIRSRRRCQKMRHRGSNENNGQHRPLCHDKHSYNRRNLPDLEDSLLFWPILLEHARHRIHILLARRRGLRTPQSTNSLL